MITSIAISLALACGSPAFEQNVATGKSLMNEARFQGAIVVFQRALLEDASDEEKAAVWISLGRIYAELGDGVEARRAFAKALDLDDDVALEGPVSPKIAEVFQDVVREREAGGAPVEEPADPPGMEAPPSDATAADPAPSESARSTEPAPGSAPNESAADELAWSPLLLTGAILGGVGALAFVGGLASYGAHAFIATESTPRPCTNPADLELDPSLRDCESQSEAYARIERDGPDVARAMDATYLGFVAGAVGGIALMATGAALVAIDLAASGME